MGILRGVCRLTYISNEDSVIFCLPLPGEKRGSWKNVAQNKDIPNASFQIADGHSLPFADNSFDVTAAITTLEFVHSAELVLQEMARCSRKPGGQLLIGVLNALARLNRNRQQSPESPYARARLFSPRHLKELLLPYSPYGVYIAAEVRL